jgi:hypothetical protein
LIRVSYSLRGGWYERENIASKYDLPGNYSDWDSDENPLSGGRTFTSKILDDEVNSLAFP